MGIINSNGYANALLNLYGNMKLKRKFVFTCCCVGLLFVIGGCSIPQRFWPQKDVVRSETAGSDGGQVVLIASRRSDFKDLLVAKLHEELSAAGVTQKTIGVDELAHVNSADYTAVIVINTCLAWGLDYDVQAFLNSQKTDANIILLTTSGNGAWLPDKGEKDFDAISAASKMTNVDAVVRDVMGSIRPRLHYKEPNQRH